MKIKEIKSHSYTIMKEDSVTHKDIINAISEKFDLDVVDSIDEKSTYIKIIIRKPNGLQEAVKQAQNKKTVV